MDPNPPESGEEFVHVDPLSESIVSLGDEVRDESSDRDETNGAVPVPEETKKVLPEELSSSVVILTCDSTAEGGTCDVYLVGTAHVSKESCREVEAIIDFLKPQVVFLELCSSRVSMLTPQNLKVASHLEIFPGSEFRVAFEEAMKYGGKVILGDRPVQITLRRTWEKMPLWHKIKLLYSFLFQAFFLPSAEDLNRMLKEMDDVDMLTLVIQEMSKAFPTLMETLVHERDQYMSSTLLKVATEHSSVVAVVGKGHLQGIKNYWKQPVPVHDLMTIPSPKPAVSALKVLSSLGVAVAGVAIISGIYINCKK
ncbi:trab domain-containing protein [Citrus sinensis]|nr:trab domain-containing protein [Citrus sinensis]